QSINGRHTDTYPNPEDYDLMFVFGGSQHVWDKASDPWLTDEIRFVSHALASGKPVIGFCLGSQIISEALGGRVFQSATKETGFYQINIKTEGETTLMKGLPNPFRSLLLHSDHYTLPTGCICEAFTPASPNQAFYSEVAPAVGFQFHPEYTKEKVRYFLEVIPDGWHIESGPCSREAVLQSLDSRPDTIGLFQILIENAIRLFNDRFHLELKS
ncbi:MAG TPA: type 1 glutamine amidotransferase, partial [Clostridia bacterium]|nr:type 1 glutamine amidotransferase [Clostridia bacterium]